MSPLFHVMMLCFRERCSRMLGTGLGRTTLYMRGVRDGVVDVFAGSSVPYLLEVSDTAVGYARRRRRRGRHIRDLSGTGVVNSTNP